MLEKNCDLFTWTTIDMSGIDPKVISHNLSICKDAISIAQKKRRMGEEKRLATEKEVCKLLDVGFIREVQYTTWLVNVLLVKKNNGQWRMCTDFTKFNKACPKDVYILPSIDRLVDRVADHKVLSFLDTYSMYN